MPWPDNDWIELPLFQVRAQRPDHRPAEFEFFMNDTAGEEWLCRRNPAITRPISEISRRTSRGIPFLVPEIQLLFKAKRHREKDEHDFRTALDLMTAAQRAWLKNALGIVHGRCVARGALTGPRTLQPRRSTKGAKNTKDTKTDGRCGSRGPRAACQTFFP